jgi:hypothetical protein
MRHQPPESNAHSGLLDSGLSSGAMKKAACSRAVDIYSRLWFASTS